MIKSNRPSILKRIANAPPQRGPSWAVLSRRVVDGDVIGRPGLDCRLAVGHRNVIRGFRLPTPRRGLHP
jgi:hypothetical protein